MLTSVPALIGPSKNLKRRKAYWSQFMKEDESQANNAQVHSQGCEAHSQPVDGGTSKRRYTAAFCLADLEQGRYTDLLINS